MPKHPKGSRHNTTEYMKQKTILLPLLLFFLTATAKSPKSVIVVDTITYVYRSNDPDESSKSAQEHAIEYAKRALLEKCFGVNVSSVVEFITSEQNHKGEFITDETFYSKNSSITKGEWLETLAEEVRRKGHNGEYWEVEVFLKGKLRELRSNPVDLEVMSINHGNYKHNERGMQIGIPTTSFKHDDCLSVRFRTPISGYVSIFLRDDTKDVVNTLLPYENSDGFASEVKNNKEYLFLSADPMYPFSSPVVLQTEKEIEHNTLIVVFSQKRFHTSLSNQGEKTSEGYIPLPDVALPKFQKWLQALRGFDETVQVQEILLTIKNK